MQSSQNRGSNAESTDIHQLSSTRLRRLLELSPAVVYARAPKPPFQLDYISPNAESFLFIKTEELTTEQSWYGRIHIDEQLIVRSELERWLRAEDTRDLQLKYRIKTMPGDYVWIEDTCRKVIENGELVDLIGSLVRIDEAMAAEQIMAKIAAVSPGVIYQFKIDRAGHPTFPLSSPKIFDIYGITPFEAKQNGWPVFHRIHPDDVEHVRASINDSAKSLSPWVCEYRASNGGDEYHWLSGHAIPEKEPDGSILWHGQIVNIDHLKHTETALQESNQRLEQAQALAGIGHWEANMETGELYWSEMIYELFGFDPRTTTPSIELFRQCVHPEDRDKVFASEQDSAKQGLHNVIHRIVRPDGEIRWVHELAENQQNAQGQRVLIGTVRDVTRFYLKPQEGMR